MISTKNPMQTLVTRMVPFTNQFQFSSYIEDDGDLFFKISSCSTENV
jgi:hypothetical protein